MKRLTEKHKALIAKFQKKTGISDYKMLWLSFAKGLIIGAIIL